MTVVLTPAPPAAAATQILGAGSTWSQVAIDQWRADVAKFGLPVNYQGVGSTAGRQFYYTGQVDFAVSEIPFQPAYCAPGAPTCINEVALAASRPYAYLPIVAGGTSFMYNLTYNGQQVRDLRISGATITKIFTGVIRNWDDPAISADDGRHFPSQSITPVIRSDGSGTSAQFTAYMAATQPALWQPFCAKEGINPCGATSQYPNFSGSIGQQLSDGVANYVAAPYGAGAITYVEYAYALDRNFPVASVLNAAGYFVQPTAENVAIALQAAQIDPNDRTQKLEQVYTNPDPRSYPVSSYSYMIAPTSTASPMTAAKGNTLSQFIYYFACTGQQKSAILGYSPLPKNLVQAAFDAAQLIPGHAPPPNINTQCDNPTITGAFTTANAPLPPANARAGAPRGGAGTGASATDANAGANAAAANATATTASASGNTSDSIDSSSNSAEQQGITGAASNLSELASSPHKVGGDTGIPVVPLVLMGVLLLAVVFLPPTVMVLRRADRGSQSGQ
jgi:phosphate ABC transporter phosphate-binding protein